ncbi:DUF2484 family protein [Acidimangrovimonas pyrenivorans]|uniref:DUF2484 family protein n=1 Tax=Acidimangrovimonas pyrenivorans TaxID=2030798 RepID=A0ABV7AH14_9RHOB
MSLAILLKDPIVWGLVWVIAAAGISALPRVWHWRGAVLLILTCIPLLGAITYLHGPVPGLIGLAVVASVLRWPLYYLGRKVWSRVGGDRA